MLFLDKKTANFVLGNEETKPKSSPSDKDLKSATDDAKPGLLESLNKLRKLLPVEVLAFLVILIPIVVETNDNFIKFIEILIISIVGGIGTGFYKWKNVKNDYTSLVGDIRKKKIKVHITLTIGSFLIYFLMSIGFVSLIWGIVGTVIDYLAIIINISILFIWNIILGIYISL